VVADVTLRLHAAPEATSAAVSTFQSPFGAASTVVDAVQCGLPLARAEYLDAVSMRAVNRAFSTAYAEADTLFLEFHGSPEEVAHYAERARSIANENGGGAFQWAIET